MPNLKVLQLDGDPYWEDADESTITSPYPLALFENLKGLKTLELKHSIQSTSIQDWGHMLLTLIHKMKDLTNCKIDFCKQVQAYNQHLQSVVLAFFSLQPGRKRPLTYSV